MKKLRLNIVKFLEKNTRTLRRPFERIIFKRGYEPAVNVLNIEISGCCNSKCRYCCTPTGNHKTSIKFMTANKFEKILKHLLKEKIISKDRSIIELYSWGEPFLNKELNDIISIAGKYNKLVSISSNFIKFPSQIEPENYKNIESVIFSLCSLDEEKYKYMYGADLKKVLENFDKFLELRNKYNPNLVVDVHFLLYKFSVDENQQAHEYFKQRGIELQVKEFHAGISDGNAMTNFVATGKIDGYNYEEISKDVDLERIQKIFQYAEEGVLCPLKENLYINEAGQLTLCCGMTSKNKEYNLGDILNLNKKQILEIKSSQNYCKFCEKLKIPWYIVEGGNLTV